MHCTNVTRAVLTELFYLTCQLVFLFRRCSLAHSASIFIFVLHKRPRKKSMNWVLKLWAIAMAKAMVKMYAEYIAQCLFCPRVSYKIHSDLTFRRSLISGLSCLKILSSQIRLCSMTLYPEQIRRRLAIHKVLPKILVYLKKPFGVCYGGEPWHTPVWDWGCRATAQEHQQLRCLSSECLLYGASMEWSTWMK